MAVTAKWYSKAFDAAFKKKIDVSADTFKALLVTSSYTFDQDAHDFKDDLTNEVTGTGYTAGGATLSSVTFTYNTSTNTFALDAADVSWASSTITARGCVIYDSTPGTDATRPLMIFIDFGADVATTAGTLTITFDSGGIATVTVA